MRSGQLRDAMVVRLRAAYAQWPTFESLPEMTLRESQAYNLRADVQAFARLDANDAVTSKEIRQVDYIAALYEACARSTPAGRFGNTILATSL
jgi:hypothetical protein